MKEKTPLFWGISAKAQALLMQYQWDTYGTKLSVPPASKAPPLPEVSEDEELEEIDRIMRQPPSRSRGQSA